MLRPFLPSAPVALLAFLVAVLVGAGAIFTPVPTSAAELLSDLEWPLGPFASRAHLLPSFEAAPTGRIGASGAAALRKLASGARVGIQVGHWKNAELPAELSTLKGSTGAKGKDWAEVDVNLDVARRVAVQLERAGVRVDLIPATVPVRYRADLFVSLHCDANNDLSLSGYKSARARWSTIPEREDALVADLNSEYRAGTGLQEHPKTITEAMRQYYAFNQRLQHAVAPTTPSAILEMGFLTNAHDRRLLTEQPDRAAQAIANGILKFLSR